MLSAFPVWLQVIGAFASYGVFRWLWNRMREYFDLHTSKQNRFQQQILERTERQQRQIDDLRDTVSKLKTRALTAEIKNLLLFRQVNRLRLANDMQQLDPKKYKIESPIGDDIPVDLTTIVEEYPNPDE